MTLSEFRRTLETLNEVNFIQPNGNFVPRHYHLTEIGLTTKQFIDCGGSVHTDKKACLQLWVANDFDHRLMPKKLIGIMDTSEPLFDGEDLEIEVEFENDTVGKYGVSFNGQNFTLTSTKTDCLAGDLCGIGDVNHKAKLSLAELGKTASSCCTPSSGCC